MGPSDDGRMAALATLASFSTLANLAPLAPLATLPISGNASNLEPTFMEGGGLGARGQYPALFTREHWWDPPTMAAWQR